MDFTIGSPSPVPRTSFFAEVSSLENSSKIWERNSSLMPMPVSVQVKTYCACLSSDATSLSDIWMVCPLGVYLIALLTMFNWISCNLVFIANGILMSDMDFFE